MSYEGIIVDLVHLFLETYDLTFCQIVYPGLTIFVISFQVIKLKFFNQPVVQLCIHVPPERLELPLLTLKVFSFNQLSYGGIEALVRFKLTNNCFAGNPLKSLGYRAIVLTEGLEPPTAKV